MTACTIVAVQLAFGKMSDMTRSGLISAIASKFPQLSWEDVEAAAMTILDAMSQSLCRGSRIEIRGFGSFYLTYRPPRAGRNPNTGEKVDVPAKCVPHFKVGKELKDRVSRQLDLTTDERKSA